MLLKSPAKINLFLRVLGKRSDHYHEIASLIQAVSLFDTLDFQPTNEDAFFCSDPTLPKNGNNLVVKARDLFRELTGCKAPVKIILHKNIPAEAGLGGGSGNAATTLYGLNALFSTGLNDAALKEAGAKLGSDIPFFFSSGRAFCSGRGEKVVDVRGTSALFTIFKPLRGLSTKEVYSRFAQDKASNIAPQSLLKDFEVGSAIYLNDLEKPAFNASPELKLLKKDISRYLPNLLMSGSGSSFFAEGALSEMGKKFLIANYPGLQVFEAASAYRTFTSWYS
jgi:4-diphosphocytidyl-2-C-methyl-D-erythritol kinase